MSTIDSRFPGRLDRRGLLAGGAAAMGLAACHSTSTGLHASGASDGTEEILDGLADRSAGWQPIVEAERAPRRARAAELLRRAGLDALVLESGPTLSYLSGVGWGRSERLFALVLMASGERFWVVPAFEAPRAARLIAEQQQDELDLFTWKEHEYPWNPLAAELARRGATKIAVDPGARVFVFDRLALAMGRERVVSAAGIVAELRGRKDGREIELLRGASELTKLAIAHVARRLPEGTTDFELGRLLEAAQERVGLGATWCLPLIGANAAFPHGSPEGRRIAAGDLVLVDTGGALHGYQSDVTRTWVFRGEPTADVARAWSTVRRAQEQAFALMKPGVRCREIDAAARGVIEAAGYGEGYAAFAHRLGHGIGLEGHEDPYFDGGSEVVLEPGMTFSDEPGVYLPGELGVRLEDVVVISETGAEVFGAWQESPLMPG